MENQIIEKNICNLQPVIKLPEWKLKPVVELSSITCSLRCFTTMERYKIFLGFLSSGRGRWEPYKIIQPKRKSPERIAIEEEELKEWKKEKVRHYKDIYPYSVTGNAIKLWDAQNMEKALRRLRNKKELPAGFDVYFALHFQKIVERIQMDPSPDIKEYLHIKRITDEEDLLKLQEAYPEDFERIMRY